jgi:4-hydroxy-3-methylbut-2-enyl diphosphate reductase
MRSVTADRKRVLLAKPRGYCAGVDRAVQTVEEALKLYGAPVYVRKQIVHNKHVVNTLEAAGAIFVEENEEVPEGSTVVFSAHGVAPEVHEQARARNLKAIDATCPLVTKVHQEAKRFAGDDYDILLIGHEGHEEVVGTSGEAPAHIQLVDGPDAVDQVTVRDPAKVVWLSQTTLSVDETMETVARLKTRLPLLQSPPSDDICYATQNRQHVVKEIASECDVVIVVGSKNSSNSVRLVEVALDAGARAGTWSTTRRRSATSGWPAPRRSASRPAPAFPRSWSCRCWRTSPSAASARSPSTRRPRSGSPSRCHRSCAAT